MNLEPIGYVRSPVTEGVDQDWGNVESEVILNEAYAAGLVGLEGFSHVIVIFYMHQSSWNVNSDLVRRPQGRSDLNPIGIFAQRAKHRPNPLGITAVEVVSVVGNVLTVRGLDAIDGTPILDLKPYFPAYDRRDAYTPAWVDDLMKNYF
jgi:tRNA (adenine37-N6)-methyltransferase